MASRPAATVEPGSAMPFQRSAGSAVSIGFGALLTPPRPGSATTLSLVEARTRIARGIGVVGRPLAARCAGRARYAGGGR